MGLKPPTRLVPVINHWYPHLFLKLWGGGRLTSQKKFSSPNHWFLRGELLQFREGVSEGVSAWRITRVSKPELVSKLGSPLFTKPFRPFGRVPPTLLGGLTTTIVINHSSSPGMILQAAPFCRSELVVLELLNYNLATFSGESRCKLKSTIQSQNNNHVEDTLSFTSDILVQRIHLQLSERAGWVK